MNWYYKYCPTILNHTENDDRTHHDYCHKISIQRRSAWFAYTQHLLDQRNVDIVWETKVVLGGSLVRLIERRGPIHEIN